MHVAIAGSRGFPYIYSGYETFVAEVAPRLVARGHHVTVYCHRELFAPRPLEVRGVRLVYAPGSRRKSLSQLSHSLSVILHLIFWRRNRPDVLLFVNVANGLFGPVLWATRMHTAINVDGVEWQRPKWSGLGARVFRFAARLAARTFDVLITDAQAMADIYRREFKAPSTVIEYGAALWESRTPERLAELGLRHHDYFLIVGRLIPDNNVLLMVEEFVRSGSQRKLVVLGDVPYRDAYADAVRGIADGRLVFPGYVRDQDLLRELYCGSYAYLHGHEFGGTNPALLKALGAGCCILALDTPFAREVLAEDRHGLYFDKTSGSAARAIAAIEASPGRAEGYRTIARERITQHYTWDRIVAAYERTFDDLRRS